MSDDIIPLLKKQFDEWLATLAGNRGIDRDSKQCTMCGWCCAVRPCIPTPNEVHLIAAMLGRKLKNCIECYFVFDEYVEGQTFLIPARVSQRDLAGHMLPSHRTYDRSQCVFFHIPGGCTIYRVRPQQARTIKCWKKDGSDRRATAVAVASWKDVDFKAWCGIVPEKRIYGV